MSAKPPYDLEAFRAAASTLGLRLEAPEQKWWKKNDFIVLVGAVDDVRVQVQHSITNLLYLDFQARIEPASDLGLSIKRRVSSFQARGAPTGDAALDEAFAVDAAETARLGPLFTAEVRASLHGWLEERAQARAAGHGALAKAIQLLWANDEHVVVNAQTGNNTFFGERVSTDEIVRVTRACARLAKALGAALPSVPPSSFLAPHVEAWRGFASSQKLAFTASPLRLDGVYDGVRFTARATASRPRIEKLGAANAYAVELSLPFARPLRSYVHVAPGLAWYDDGAPKQSTDDAAFDAAFGTRASDPDFVRAALDADVRSTLLGISKEHGEVALTPEGLTVGLGSMVAPEAFARVLAPLARVEKQLERFF
jgi:hypothetical protein